MFSSARLCLQLQQIQTPAYKTSPRSVDDACDSIIDDVAQLIRHHKTHHATQHVPLVMVYAIALCLHVLKKRNVLHTARPTTPLLLDTLASCGRVWTIAAEIHAKYADMLSREYRFSGDAPTSSLLSDRNTPAPSSSALVRE